MINDFGLDSGKLERHQFNKLAWQVDQMLSLIWQIRRDLTPETAQEKLKQDIGRLENIDKELVELQKLNAVQKSIRIKQFINKQRDDLKKTISMLLDAQKQNKLLYPEVTDSLEDLLSGLKNFRQLLPGTLTTDAPPPEDDEKKKRK